MKKLSRLFILIIGLQCFINSQLSFAQYHWDIYPVTSQFTQFIKEDKDWSAYIFSFTDSLHGYLRVPNYDHPSVLNAPIYHTTNGGTSWQELEFPELLSRTIINVIGVSSGSLYASQLSSAYSTIPSLLRSVDYGVTWQVCNWTPLFGGGFVHMWSDSLGYMFYTDETDRHQSYLKPYAGFLVDSGSIASDDTLSYEFLRKYYRGVFTQVTWPEPGNGIVWMRNSSSPLLITTDSGRTWKDELITDSMGKPIRIQSLKRLKESAYVWATFVKSPLSNRFGYSSDYGTTWKVSEPFNDLFFKEIVPINDNELWGIASSTMNGYYDRIIYSSDKGKSWIIDSITATDYNLRGITFIDRDHGWAYASAKANEDTAMYLFKYSSETLRVTPHARDEQSLKLWPNPCATAVEILLPESQPSHDYTLRVMDVLGREVEVIQGRTVGNKVHYNVDKLRPGYYILQLLSGLKSYTSRFTVVH